jgi:cytochrome c-type biogenesis protein CcmH
VFWLAAILIVIGATAVLCLPLFRTDRPSEQTSPDAMVYRDQLSEIERDHARGIIDAVEAVAARAEVARRLLNVNQTADSRNIASITKSMAWTVAIVAVVTILTVPLYLQLGDPAMPDQPLASRLQSPTNQQNLPQLVAQMEKVLLENPDEGRGWQLIAPIYMRLARFDDAVIAFTRIVELFGPTAPRLAQLAEAQISVSEGLVSEQTQAILEQAISLDPQNHISLFHLARAAEQRQQPAQATTYWQRLVSASAPTDPWVSFAQERLASLSGGKPDAPSGPTAEEIASAEEMTPQQRQEMIAQMVSNLAERLQTEPQDLEGWLRLIRSYIVLNRTSDATKSLATAKSVFVDDKPALTKIDALAQELRLEPVQ